MPKGKSNKNPHAMPYVWRKRVGTGTAKRPPTPHMELKKPKSPSFKGTTAETRVNKGKVKPNFKFKGGGIAIPNLPGDETWNKYAKRGLPRKKLK